MADDGGPNRGTVQRRLRGTLGATVGALALAAAFGGCAGSADPGVTSAATTAPATYGGWPTFLPDPAAGRAPLTGSQANPAVAPQGQEVTAELPGGGTVQVAIVGPEVPREALPQLPISTTCTWTVTFTAPTVPLPIAAEHFVAQDASGTVYHPTFVPDHPAPAVLQPGESVSFELQTSMRTGEGMIAWAPDGLQQVASWFFVIEID